MDNRYDNFPAYSTAHNGANFHEFFLHFITTDPTCKSMLENGLKDHAFLSRIFNNLYSLNNLPLENNINSFIASATKDQFKLWVYEHTKFTADMMLSPKGKLNEDILQAFANAVGMEPKKFQIALYGKNPDKEQISHVANMIMSGIIVGWSMILNDAMPTHKELEHFLPYISGFSESGNRLDESFNTLASGGLSLTKINDYIASEKTLHTLEKTLHTLENYIESHIKHLEDLAINKELIKIVTDIRGWRDNPPADFMNAYQKQMKKIHENHSKDSAATLKDIDQVISYLTGKPFHQSMIYESFKARIELLNHLLNPQDKDTQHLITTLLGNARKLETFGTLNFQNTVDSLNEILAAELNKKLGPDLMNKCNTSTEKFLKSIGTHKNYENHLIEHKSDLNKIYKEFTLQNKENISNTNKI